MYSVRIVLTGLVGAAIGAGAGWMLGSLADFFVAYVSAVLGLAVGWYVGARIGRTYLE